MGASFSTFVLFHIAPIILLIKNMWEHKTHYCACDLLCHDPIQSEFSLNFNGMDRTSSAYILSSAQSRQRARRGPATGHTCTCTDIHKSELPAFLLVSRTNYIIT